MSALSIRRDRTPTVLRKLAKGESDARITRRILAIANALDGMSREEAAQAAGMDRQTLRDWVIRYNERLRSTRSADFCEMSLEANEPFGRSGSRGKRREGEMLARRNYPPPGQQALSHALVDDNIRHVNIVVCEADYKALEYLPPPMQ